MPESEARTATGGVDCSGATEANPLIESLGLQLGLAYLQKMVAEAKAEPTSERFSKVEMMIESLQDEYNYLATADDADESGVQETESFERPR